MAEQLPIEHLGKDGGDEVYEAPDGSQRRVPEAGAWDDLLPKQKDEK